MPDDHDNHKPLALGRGGLRRGHTGASDEGSKRLDTDLKEIARELALELRHLNGLKMKTAVPKEDTITPCVPDGGAWFYRGVLVAVFEAKKQQNAGNAIERWYKNMYRCRDLNPEVSYVTFCRGEGARPMGVMGVALDVAQDGWNAYYPGGNSCWMEPSGFTKEFLKETMRLIIEECVKRNRS